MARRRRHRRHRDEGKVELNVTAMLDMAFQLLAFFILTFRPASVEGQLAVNLPPPVAMTQVQTEPQNSDEEGTGDSGRETLHLFVTASDQGLADEVRFGGYTAAKGPLDQFQLQQINQRLKALFSLPVVPFDHVQIAVDGRLHYEELMKLIDVCTQQKLPDGQPLTKISFTELPRGAGQE
jgi:biopolymer transport protein ExbD